MVTNLQHEDLLIKLRARLNDEKIKLWESPYLVPDDTIISQSLKDLATKYAIELSSTEDTILNALHELQLHSLERSKANAEFKETGCATLRVRATMPGEKALIITLRKRLDVMGSDLITSVAEEVKVVDSRVKLIFNGKVIKPTPSLEEQGVKNGVQIMALIMAETPEEAKQEDTMYMEMKQTRDDATLLSECVDELAGDEYMKLEDQSGNAIQLPAAEKRSLLVGLTLHERGRAHIKKQEYALALVLLLEADRLFSECRSAILQSVDNYGVLQVDVAWCYLCLRALQGAGDAARRLAAAERALAATYGERGERLRALKGTDANERVLFMRLYLLQGIVAYHQNQRAEARQLLEKAEAEINGLRVDENAVTALMELGWSGAAARAGLRVARGGLQQAHHYLAERRDTRHRARAAHRDQRQQRLLGICIDGAPVKQQLVEALVGMGYTRRLATLALRNSNNHVAEAVRIIQEQPEMLADDSDLSTDDTGTPSSEDSVVEPDNKLVAELETMGYDAEDARVALSRAKNHISGAVDLLVATGGNIANAEQANPSTSSGAVKRKQKKHKVDKKKRERMQALQRLHTVIHGEEDDYLDTSLQEEEEFLVQYKSLL